MWVIDRARVVDTGSKHLTDKVPKRAVTKPDCLKDKGGSALIVTLLVITALTGLTIAFSEDSNIELTLAGFSRNFHRAHQLSSSGVYIALSLLDKDENMDMDSLTEPWSNAVEESFPGEIPAGLLLSTRVVDENRKLNINYLRKETGEIDEKRAEQFLRLFRSLGLKEEMVDPILDWLDGDDIKRMDGAENDFYEGLDDPYPCANGPFPTPGQIFLVKGLGEVYRFGEDGEKSLLDFLTIYGDGTVNINTAPPEILQSLDEGIDSIVADAIVEYRREEDFLTIEDLKKVSAVDGGLFDRIKGLINVKSSYFTIETTGRSQEAVSSIKAVAVREDNELKLIYWQVV